MRLLAACVLSLPLCFLPSFGSAASLPQEETVNGHLNLDASALEPFEIEWERALQDTTVARTTRRFQVSTPSDAEPVILARRDYEIFDWKLGFPKKIRHNTFEYTARARDLAPLHARIVYHRWDEGPGAWHTQRWDLTFEPGRVIERLSAPGSSHVKEFDVPLGVLQEPMMHIALGLQAEPTDLVISYFDFTNEVAVERSFTIQDLVAVEVAGEDIEAIEFHWSDSSDPENLRSSVYDSGRPWIHLGNPPDVTRLRVERFEAAP